MTLAISFYGEGNGTPLQYSRLENPMDGAQDINTVKEESMVLLKLIHINEGMKFDTNPDGN